MKRENETKLAPDILDRNFRFAIRVVKLCGVLDESGGVSRILMPQILRAGTSIVSNIEEAQAGQSRADFISKLGIAFREARETHVRLRILSRAAVVPAGRLGFITNEAEEIKRILDTLVSSPRRRTELAA